MITTDRPPVLATHEELYRAKVGVHALVEVPPARFLVINGAGTPGGPGFQQALAALYGIAYTAKFSLKNAGGPVFKVPPLEGLFDAFADPAEPYGPELHDQLRWTLMIRMPEPVDAGLVSAARATLAGKRDLPALAEVRFEEFDEGLCAQVLHLGPYAEEPATVAALHDFIRGQGHSLRGRHHEIYFSVPGRTRPERMKTLIRQPVS